MSANLIEALCTWADSDSWFAENFPGGIWNTDAATGTTTPLPYLVFTQGESRNLNIIGSPLRSVVFYTVQLEARAALAEDARNLGEQVRQQILSGPPLSWAGGLECGRLEIDGEGGELEEGLGPDGSDVWVHRIPIQFTTARG